MENKKYQEIYHLTSEFARLYNYAYTFSDLSNFNGKVYTIDNYERDKECKVTFLTRCSLEDNIYAEHISLMFNLLRELGIDAMVNVIDKKSLLNYLDYLNVDYEINNNLEDNIICTYIDDEKVGYTKYNKKDLIITSEINIKILIEKMHELQEENLDVCIIAESKEEKLKASILLNDLRLTGIACDTGYLDLDKNGQIDRYPGARNLIILDDEDLQKGLITVRDNLTKEDVKVPEDEIIDYILGVL